MMLAEDLALLRENSSWSEAGSFLFLFLVLFDSSTIDIFFDDLGLQVILPNYAVRLLLKAIHLGLSTYSVY